MLDDKNMLCMKYVCLNAVQNSCLPGLVFGLVLVPRGSL